MMKSFREWLGEGETIYATASHGISEPGAAAPVDQAATRFKAHEVNQIAQVIGKPALEVNRRISAVIEPPLGGGLVGNMTRA